MGPLLPSGHKCLLPPPLPTQPQPVPRTTLTNASALAGPTAAFAPVAWPRPPVLCADAVRRSPAAVWGIVILASRPPGLKVKLEFPDN